MRTRSAGAFHLGAHSEGKPQDRILTTQNTDSHGKNQLRFLLPCLSVLSVVQVLPGFRIGAL